MFCEEDNMTRFMLQKRNREPCREWIGYELSLKAEKQFKGCCNNPVR